MITSETARQRLPDSARKETLSLRVYSFSAYSTAAMVVAEPS